jgi:hypothetical protein
MVTRELTAGPSDDGTIFDLVREAKVSAAA